MVSGGVQLGLVGVVLPVVDGGLGVGLGVGFGVGLGVGKVSARGKVQLKEQLVPRVRDKIRISKITKYFMFALFIAILL